MKRDIVISIIFRVISYAAFAIVIAIFLTFILEGFMYFSPEFFTQFPQMGMTKGGIFPAIIGSVSVLLLSLAVAIPLGVFTGVFLSEYAGKGFFSKIVDTSITALSGVPSIVYGLFGLSIFCITLGFRTSILSGSLTLAIMTLPVISSSVREALQAVPRELRESAYALGAKKSEVVFKVVLTAAKERIITAVLIGGGRVIGETAPILLTGAIFYSTTMPKGILDPVMTLPSHIYYITMAYGQSAQWMAKGASAFLMIFILIIYSTAFYIRRKISNAHK